MNVLSAIKRILTGRWREPAPSPLRMGPNGSFVFIHINKCAGTSIGAALGLPMKQHLTAIEVIDMIGGEAWRRAFKFSIVRNPWDKVVSHYKYRVKTAKAGMGKNPPSFKDWVAMTYGGRKDPRYYNKPKMFQQQVEWLKNRRGEIDMDYIGRFEDLPGAFAAIVNRLGMDAVLPHLNNTEKRDFREYYDDDTVEMIARWFADDIARFDYHFRE